MRALGVDFGGKRIGIAVGEADFSVFSPRPALNASGTLARDAEALCQLADREEVALVVLGHPEHEGDPRMARVVEQLADLIRARGWRVELVDESLTSVEAQSALREAGRTGGQRRRAVDGEAACRILERFFQA